MTMVRLKEDLELKSESHANKMLYASCTVALAQLITMADLIFVTYSWDVIEPITYLL